MNNREFYIDEFEFDIQVSSFTRENYEKVIYLNDFSESESS